METEVMATEGKQEGRPGRREKRPGQPKAGVMTFRVRAGMRDNIQSSAEKRGLSISEEVERRLTLSFEIANNPYNDYIVRSAAEAISKVEEITRSSWVKDLPTARMCHAAVVAATSVMTAIHDKSDDADEHAVIEAAGDVIGIQVALKFAGFPTESIVKFGRIDIDFAIDVIREKLVHQINKAQERDPDSVPVEIDAIEGSGLGLAPPPAVQDPTKLENALQVMDHKRKTRRSGKP